jgi:L-alanine-DL-glutamate epimerase-like enolase superfamily enzyme
VSPTTVAELRTRAHRIPLPDPETDGTLAWNATTVVTVEATAGGQVGLGWTYGPAAIASVIDEILAPVVAGRAAVDVGLSFLRMRQASRNATSPGLVTLGISAVDVALWDLKAKLLDVPIAVLLGRIHARIPLYGSGGFTSLTDSQLVKQLTGWVVDDGMTAVKIKIAEDRGGNVERDLSRIDLARRTIGPDVALMVDANGGYQTKQAVQLIADAQRQRVSWFEEPVSSQHLADLALLRGMLTPEVTAGEYGTTTEYFRAMLSAGAVDCLQVDASRCGGYTGALAAAAVADSFGVQVSTHCAPHLHAPVCAALPNLRHAEWFADHVRADGMVFDGLGVPSAGMLPVQTERPGHGVVLKPAPGTGE